MFYFFIFFKFKLFLCPLTKKKKKDKQGLKEIIKKNVPSCKANLRLASLHHYYTMHPGKKVDNLCINTHKEKRRKTNNFLSAHGSNSFKDLTPQ